MKTVAKWIWAGVFVAATGCGNEAAPNASAVEEQVGYSEVDGAKVLGRLVRTNEIEPGHTLYYFEIDKDSRLVMETLKRDQTPTIKAKNSSALELDACSDDVYGDMWGYQWFIDGFCYPGPADLCKMDQDRFDQADGNYAEYRSAKHFTWVAMEGDFNSFGYSEVYSFPGWGGPGEKQLMWSSWVPPRDVYVFDYTTSKSRFFGGRVDSPCGHMHVAATWE